MPTATDQQLADRLAELRIDTEKRFGSLERDLSGFRSSVETELRIIRKLGAWLLGGVFGVVAALITGAAAVAWSASAVVAEVGHQGQRLDKLEGRFDKLETRLDGIGKQLDTLISRSAPGPAAKSGG